MEAQEHQLLSQTTRHPNAKASAHRFDARGPCRRHRMLGRSPVSAIAKKGASKIWHACRSLGLKKIVRIYGVSGLALACFTFEKYHISPINFALISQEVGPNFDQISRTSEELAVATKF
jgi:hypothetical protein